MRGHKEQDEQAYQVGREIEAHHIDALRRDTDRFYLWSAPNADSELVILSWDGGQDWRVCVYATPDDWENDEASECHECDLSTDTPADLFARVYFGE